MPFTPYHFGPSGFIGLVLRKWIDVPVFVLANVIIDIEVLLIMVLHLGRPYHRYCHTLLIGAAVGALWGMAAYPLRGLFKRAMHTLRLSYEPSFWKMALSGMLGACIHVLIDGAYHHDVRVFWPNTTISLWEILRDHITREQGRIICVALFVAAVVYVLALFASGGDTTENKMSDCGK
ncbi:MAG: hypothetical protein U9Q07_05790 [Planctomycetota bacterium]|nr:hypothetical protein [Planctomycetota bacterium]